MHITFTVILEIYFSAATVICKKLANQNLE
jgi:hypothetical protein